MKTTELIRKIESGALDTIFVKLYGKADAEGQKARYIRTIKNFEADYGVDRDVSLFSVPGRSEISGNHTDHNHGCVLAAAINLDIIAVAAKNSDGLVRLRSEGYSEDRMTVAECAKPNSDYFFKSRALIAGMVQGFVNYGHKAGGFDAFTTNNVHKGSGLSSSAAFEVMVGNIINHFYNDGSVDNAEVARIAQFSENEYFGKPCGMMDQLICAVGGVVSADFADPQAPQYRKIEYDFAESGHALAIIECGAGHENLTADYAQITKDMRLIAVDLGHERLCEATAAEFYSVFPLLRQKYGDRPVFRAMHFFEETRRAAEEANALSAGNFEEFLRLYRESAESSEQYLQNIVSENEPTHRLANAISAARNILSGAGAVRVHGGGFAGTAQAFVPEEMKQKFSKEMQSAGFSCLWPEIV